MTDPTRKGHTTGCNNARHRGWHRTRAYTNRDDVKMTEWTCSCGTMTQNIKTGQMPGNR